MRNKPMGGRDVFLVDVARTPFFFTDSIDLVALAVRSAESFLLRQSWVRGAIDTLIFSGMTAMPTMAASLAEALGLIHPLQTQTFRDTNALGLQSFEAAMASIQLGRSDVVLLGAAETPQERFHSGLKPVPFSSIECDESAYWRLVSEAKLSFNALNHWALESHRKAKGFWKTQEASAVLMSVFGEDGFFVEQDETLCAELVPTDRQEENLLNCNPRTAAHFPIASGGAAFLLLASADAVERYRLPVLGAVRACQSQLSHQSHLPWHLQMLEALVTFLETVGLSFSEVDLWELPELSTAHFEVLSAAFSDPGVFEQLNLMSIFGELQSNRVNVLGGELAHGFAGSVTSLSKLVHALMALQTRAVPHAVVSYSNFAHETSTIWLEHFPGEVE